MLAVAGGRSGAIQARPTAPQWRMPEPSRQKITFGEMRAAGVRGLLIYCFDFRCSQWTAISGDRWPDGVRLSDIESRFTCQAAVSGERMSAPISIGKRAAGDGSGVGPIPARIQRARDPYTPGPLVRCGGPNGVHPV